MGEDGRGDSNNMKLESQQEPMRNAVVMHFSGLYTAALHE